MWLINVNFNGNTSKNLNLIENCQLNCHFWSIILTFLSIITKSTLVNGNFNGNFFLSSMSMAKSMSIFLVSEFQWQYQYQLLQLLLVNINCLSINGHVDLSISMAMSIFPNLPCQLSMAISIPPKSQYQWHLQYYCSCLPNMVVGQSGGPPDEKQKLL